MDVDLFDDDERTMPKRVKFSQKYRQSLAHLKPFRLWNERETSRIDQSGCLSFITYGWIFSYLWNTYRGIMPNIDQKWSCSSYDSTSVNTARLEYLWNQEKNLAKQQAREPSVFKAVWRMVKTRIIVACFIFLICLIFGFIGPACLVRSLIAHVETRNNDLWNGLVIVFSLTFIELIRAVAYGATWAVSFRTAVRLRNALLGLLYKKLLSARSVSDKGVGTIVNVFANDAQRLFEAVTFVPLVVMGPLVLVGGMIYLLWLIGPWSLVGFAVFLFVVVIQSALGVTMKRCRVRAIAMSNQRVKLIAEILQSIRYVKVNAFEKPLTDRVYETRRLEEKHLKSAALAQSLAIAAGPVVPVVAAVATFTGYMLNGNFLEPSRAFSAMTVFFVMVLGIRAIPYGMRFIAEASVALRTIQQYYFLMDCQNHKVQSIADKSVLKINNASFTNITDTNSSCEKDEKLLAHDSGPIVKNLTLSLFQNQLIGICGRTGSGKSSLLKAILGEIWLTHGDVKVAGTTAYVGQEPWIFQGTIKENIIFGENFDSNKYQRVLEACCLTRDLDLMPQKDLTQVGEQGSMLSGGQKARLSLARCLYSNNDIYLIDDALSALDTKVANAVFVEAIKTYLKQKAVIFVTNQVHYLEQMDHVVFMENGQVLVQGHHASIQLSCPTYTEFCKTVNKATDSSNDIDSQVLHDSSITQDKSTNEEVHEENANAENPLLETEENYGLKPVAFSVYKSYISSLGGFVVFTVVVLAFVFNVVCTLFSTVWLAEWLKAQHSSQVLAHQDHTINNNTSIALQVPSRDDYKSFSNLYLLSIVFMTVTSFVKAIVFVKVTLNASSKLHNKTLNKIMRGSMSWFDMTNPGKIINRFSKDIDDLDVKVPFNAECFLQNCFQIVGCLAVIAWVFPWFLLACVPLSAVFFVFVGCFRSGIRSLKRSENNSRTPLFGLVESTVRGATTIRVMGKSAHHFGIFKRFLDVNSGCVFMYNCAMHWLAVWLDLIVVLITFVTSLLIVLLADYVEPSYAGMVLAFAIQMSGVFQFAVRTHAEFESHLTAVERLSYLRKDCEQESQDVYTADSKGWPKSASLEFSNVSLTYKNGKTALQNVNFKLNASEKLGVVGRTGSGKTSIGSTLLRLYPIDCGTVFIDGTDIAQIGLDILRSSVATVPQEPVLFSGTIRFNLDMDNKHTDDQLWSALEAVRMRDMVKTLDHGLDSEILEGGSNISAGQRQLLCLARALLKRVKIVLLDEATANVDDQTDALIEENVKNTFRDCTMLIIAHKAGSIAFTDRVMLMDSGKVLRIGPPQELMSSDESANIAESVRETPEN